MEDFKPSAFTPFFRRFTDERALELSDTIALYNEVKSSLRGTLWGKPGALENVLEHIVTDVSRYMDLPMGPVRDALDDCLHNLLVLETTLFSFPEIDWNSAVLSLKEQVDLRHFLRAQQHFLANPDRAVAFLIRDLGNLYGGLYAQIPPLGSDGPVFAIPLLSLLKDPYDCVDRIIGTFSKTDSGDAGLFAALARQLYLNICAASGVVPDQEHKKPLKSAADSKLPPQDMAQAWLRHTPLIDLMNAPMPFSIPEAARFEHQWIVAGSGHGKSQTLQYLIAHDLEKVANDEASIVVIDSQGDLIRNISRLQFFADHPDKLCLIDPTDIEYPVALNLFDVGMDRIKEYSPLDRERLINGILELYDFVMGTLLSAELTQKQGVIFRYITRLMLHIPNATIQTLRELMEPKGYEKYKEHIMKLQGTARAFFETEFQSKQFEDTKRQVVRRLWGILENSTFERMFSHPRSKLNLFEEMNSGKVILINTAKELLKQQGTEIFGRFFIAMIAQATQERATLSAGSRMPTFVYVDECQDYMDANVALILEQARKFNVGMVLAHQYIGQLAPKLQESFSANTSIKFAGGVSDKDARALSGMLRCTPEFIEAQPKGYFAAFVRNYTDHAISLGVPFGYLESLERMSDDDWTAVREKMRERYAVHHSEVEAHISSQLNQGPNPMQSGASSKSKSDADDVDTRPSTEW